VKTVIVLAMHGIPASDYPGQRLAELMALHHRLDQLDGSEKEMARARFEALDAELRNWPRTPQNDPFHHFSLELARELESMTHTETVVGFNEFCAPDVYQTLQEAVTCGAGRIIVVTPMLTRGGEHAEREIPAIIRKFSDTYPEVEIIYAWPFEKSAIAGFLKQNMERYL